MSGQKIITGLQEAIVMTDDLVTRLKDGFAIRTVIGGYAPDIGGTVQIMAEAAARIESDAATIARLEGERDSASGLALTLQAECERLHGDVAAAEAKLAALVEALEAMRGAVCGETGFAECVRRDSGKAYPWPALDAADEAARAAIAAAKGWVE